MKLIAIFDSRDQFLNSDELRTAKHDSDKTGNWHFLETPGGVIFVCEPKDHGKAEEHLVAIGAKVFPHIMGHEPIGQELAGHRALAGANILSTDSHYLAARKIADTIWRQADPR